MFSTEFSDTTGYQDEDNLLWSQVVKPPDDGRALAAEWRQSASAQQPRERQATVRRTTPGYFRRVAMNKA
jgi:hypothetical protein